ncbi:unnamed protein product (macronuclear) [Paramecium tetraurelia]|uniref:DNA2/NAM7 helicase-like C-terminal domain-containing protein n=1 Tax=Paramecium tetraurelia TaxID=5888 RepID=A0C248_PARTE|nr:uncharacterized protein GSPATT00034342001 [Paramecium tetraurelia]CAK64865.1 unnamed protein product [Paramecium tetraurelia]|eukprot:XP_001432262.1 hypothetical protein (macronuclear) [Paramecium tetraurelia strain d4-2]
MDNNYSQYSSPMHLLSNVAFKKAILYNSNGNRSNLTGYKKFQSVNEYQKRFFPLLQNEYYRSIARDKKSFLYGLQDGESFPLKLKIITCELEDNGPFKINIESELEELDPKITKKSLWKYRHYSDYLIFKESSSYIGAIYMRNLDQLNDYYTSLAIFRKKDDDQHILVPNNIFKYFPVDILDSPFIYFQPFCPLSAYQTETDCLFLLQQCPYFDLILNPIEQLNQVQTSEFAQYVNEQRQYYIQNEVFKRHFNEEQLLAIKMALDYHQRFTLIKGPPGTGKTQTILGIISIMADLLVQKDKENEKQGGILVLAKSNSVVNDLVRKIQKNIEEQNSIIYCFNQKPDFLKVIRFGRPGLCESDIEENSLEILSQKQFFQQFTNKVSQIENKHITEEIQNMLKTKNLMDYKEFLLIYKTQITLISLLNFIDDLNRQCKKPKILNAYGKFYEELSQLLKTEKKIYEGIEQSQIQNCRVIVSTLNSCTKECLRSYFERVHFRMCIVDEAPTALEPSQLIPMVKYTNNSEDSVACPIVVSRESKDYGYNRSLFERLADGLNQSTVQLFSQYRQMENLAQITSQLFYDGKLINGIKNMQLPLWILQKVSNKKNRLFFSAPPNTESRDETSRKNDLECQAIIHLVKYLLQGLDIQEHKNPITVISCYAAQKKKFITKIVG